MAAPLLDQIRSQIRARLRELEPAANEYRRLDAALNVLGGPVATRAEEPAAPQPSARRPRAAAKRAPRGANRTAVLSALADRPGATASELASATGVARPVLYNLLKSLDGSGEIVKEDLPSGTAGYRLVSI